MLLWSLFLADLQWPVIIKSRKTSHQNVNEVQIIVRSCQHFLRLSSDECPGSYDKRHGVNLSLAEWRAGIVDVGPVLAILCAPPVFTGCASGSSPPSPSIYDIVYTQWTQNICITFIQCWTNVEDVGPTLYKCYTNVFCSLGYAQLRRGEL